MFDSLTSELTLSASDYIREADKAERATDELADSTEQLDDKASSSGSGLSEMRSKIGTVGAIAAGAGVAGIGASISAFGDFDQAMTNSMSIMGDVGPQMEQKLSDTAREVATSTTASHKEAADSYYYLASAGLSAQESLSAMPQVAAFAQAGALDMATATDYATDVMSAFGLEIEDLGRVTDTMTGAVVRHNTDVDQMGQAMAYVAPVAEGLGVSIEETAAAIGFMSDQGIKGTKAGTALRAGLASLASPAGAAKKTLKELGVTTVNAQGQMRPLPAILDDLKASGITTADAMKIFGREAGPGMLALLKQGGKGLRMEAKELRNLKGITQEVAQKQLKNLNAQWDIFTSKITDAAVATGGYFAPAASKLLGWLSKGVDAFSAVNNASGGLVGAITLIGTTLAGAGVALAAFWPQITRTASIIRTAFIPALAGISTPLLVVGGLVAAFAAAWATNFGNIRGITADVVATIRSTFLPVFQRARALILPILAQIGNAFNTQGSRIQSVATGLFEQIGGRLVPVIQRLGAIATSVITWIGSMWSTHGQSILSTIRLISTNLSEMLIQGMAAVRSALDGDFVQMMGAFREFKTAALNIWNAVWPAIKQAAIAGLTAAWNWIKGPGVGLARSAFSTLTTVATTAFKFGRETILPLVRDAIGAAWTWVRTSGVSLGKTALGLLGRGALTAFKFGKNNLLPAVQSAIRFAWNWVKTSGVSLAKTALSLLATGAISAFKFGKNNLLPAVQSAIRFAWTWVRTSGVQLGKTALRMLGRLAVAGFEFGKQNLLPKIQTAIRSAWNWAKTSGVQLGKTALRILGQQAVNAFSFAKNTILPKVQTAIRAGWTWVRTQGVTLGKTALRILGQQAVNGFTFTKQKILPKVRTALGGIWTWIRTTGVSLAKGALSTLVTKSAAAFTSLKAAILPKLRLAISGAVTWVKTRGLALFKGGFEAIGRGIGTTLSAILNGLPRLFAVAIPKIRTWLTNNGTSIIKGGFEAIGRGIRTFILGAFAIAGLVGQAVVSTITGIGNWLANGGATKLKNGFISIVSGIVSYLKNDAWGDLKGAAEFLFDAVMAAAEGLYDGLIGNSLIPDMFGEIASFIRNFDIFSAIDSLLSQVWERFDKLKTDALNTISNLLGTVIQNIQSWPIYQKINGVLTSVWQRFDKLKTDALNTVSNLLSETISKAQGWVEKFKKPFKNAAEWVNDKFDWLKKQVVGNSHVPDMLDDTVKAASGSWARKFTAPFRNAADAIEKRLGKLRDRAGKLAGKVGGKAKSAVKSVKKVLSGGGHVRKRAEWAGERYKTVRKGRLAGIPKPLAKQMRETYKSQVKGKRSWGSYVKRARNYGEGAHGKGTWYEDTAVAKMASGGTVLSDGLIYAHKGEDVVPAKTSQPYSGNGGSTKEIHHHEKTVVLKLAGEELLKLLRGDIEEITDDQLDEIRRELASDRNS